MSRTISDHVLAEINDAYAALDAAMSGDAQAAIDIAAVFSAQEVSNASQANALSLHSVASTKARQALTDLRAELQFNEGEAGSTPAMSTRDKVGSTFPTQHANRQHPLITHALNLGISWSDILQALIAGGLAALQKLIAGKLGGGGIFGGVPGGGVPTV